MKRNLIVFAICVFTCMVNGQVNSVSYDRNWSDHQAIVKNTSEAEYIIRIGDIDNLGFGWPENFDPFCSRMTEVHDYPWNANPDDLPGFDRILLSSKFNSRKDQHCGVDGYSGSFSGAANRPVPWNIPVEALRNVKVHNAWLQIFIDDFQAPTFCSKFLMFLNDRRFVEGEKILNAIDQTGPVGKLISVPLTEDLFPLLTSGGNLTLLIDEGNGAGDGFAIDFVRLLVNRHRENSCKGNIHGRILVRNSEEPVAGAMISTADHLMVSSDSNGEFEMKNIPSGFEVLTASAGGYIDGTGTADIGSGDDNPEILIYLEKGRSAKFNSNQIVAGQSVILNNILFEQGKAVIKAESQTELDKVVLFMRENQGADIELSGHTSSEGDREYNVSLSYLRVKACKDYITSKGIAEERIIAIGYGPDRPVAGNHNETGRSANRRVEMRLKKL